MEEDKKLNGITKYSGWFGIAGAVIVLIGYILDKVNVINLSYKEETIILGILLTLWLIEEALSFDKKHKIISTLTLFLMSFFAFKYLSKSIDILNTNYKEELMRTLDISFNYIYFTYIYINSLLKKLLIKATEYIKTAQEEYEEKIKGRDKNEKV